MSPYLRLARWLFPLLVLKLLLSAAPASAGAQARGVGHFYFKLGHATTEADRGFDSRGHSAPLASDAFLDSSTATIANNGNYDETAYRLYGEYGIMEKLDLLFALEWKEIEESFDLELNFPAFLNLPSSVKVQRENSGMGDGMLGLKYQFIDGNLPVAADLRLIFPTDYTTSVKELKLDTIDSSDDKVPLGNGIHNLVFGLSTTASPIPWTFVDARIAYVLSDLEHREFSDNLTWELKAGGSYHGPGGALFVEGSTSLGNGSAPSTISQDGDIIVDASKRVTVLNDEEWTRVGLQAWFNFRGLAIEATISKTIDGQNTTKSEAVEIAFSFQR